MKSKKGARGSKRLSYANVTATLVLIVALGTGGAFAASLVGPKDIAKNAVRAKHTKERQVRTTHIQDGVVTAPKLADGVQGLQGPKGDRGDPGPQGD